MTWTTHHRRGEVLRSAIATVDARRDGRLPMDVIGVRETFRDELDLYGALQLRWHTRLAGRIEQALAAQPLDLETAVVRAWAEVAGEMPGVRRVLDRVAEHGLGEPIADRMVERAVAKELQTLAVLAGRSSLHDAHAARVGAGLVERARALAAAPDAPASSCSRAGLIGRLRAALAA